MGSFENRKVSLKMRLVLNGSLKISVALMLINFAMIAGAIRTREFKSYRSVVKNFASRNNLITGNNAYGLYEQGDDTTHSGNSSKGSDLAVLPQANSDLYGAFKCNPQEDLQYTQVSEHLSSGIPIFRVTFTNTCLDCSFLNIHILCGDFSSANLVNPLVFRKLSNGDCLLNNGGPLAPQTTISFEYESSFSAPMTVGVAFPSCQ